MCTVYLRKTLKVIKSIMNKTRAERKNEGGTQSSNNKEKQKNKEIKKKDKMRKIVD